MFRKMRTTITMTRRQALRSFGAFAGLSTLAFSPTLLRAGQPAPAIVADAVSLADFEPLARQKLTPQAFAYVRGGEPML